MSAVIGGQIRKLIVHRRAGFLKGGAPKDWEKGAILEKQLCYSKKGGLQLICYVDLVCGIISFEKSEISPAQILGP